MFGTARIVRTRSPAATGQPSISVVRHRDASDGWHRGLEPKQLLDRAGGQVGIVGELPPVRGALRQEREAALERVGDRVEAGREHEEADVQRLVPGEAPLPLQRQEGPEHVAGVVLGVCVERRREVLEDPGARLHPHGLTVGLRLTDGTDHPLLRLDELVEPVRGQAHQAEEHDRREREGELGAEVAAPPLDERVDQLVREVGDLLLALSHACAGRTGGRASSDSGSGRVGRSGAGSLRSRDPKYIASGFDEKIAGFWRTCSTPAVEVTTAMPGFGRTTGPAAAIARHTSRASAPQMHWSNSVVRTVRAEVGGALSSKLSDVMRRS